MPHALPSFDPDFADPAGWAAMYRECGLQVVPGHMPNADPAARWKRPRLSTWTEFENELVGDAVFERWFAHPPDGQMGVITGRASGNVFVIDLDSHKGPEAEAWWNETTKDGTRPHCVTAEQRTGGGGRQLFFRAPAFWPAPTGKASTQHIDIRGQGGFAVMPPSLHSSGQEYAWLPNLGPWQIGITDAGNWLLNAIDRLIIDHGGGWKSGNGGERVPPTGEFDAFGRRLNGREDHMTRLVWGAVLELCRAAPINPGVDSTISRTAMMEAYERYTRGVQTRIANEEHERGLEREGRGLSAFEDKWRRAFRFWDTKVMEEAAKPRPFEAGGNGPDANASVSPIVLLPAFPIDATLIEPRDWVIPGLLLHRYLTLLVAPPGSGKSLLTLQLAIANAVGMSWGGWTIRKRTRTLVINAEDDISEMRRRLWAAAHIMGVAQADLEGWLFLVEVPESIVVARTDPRTKAVAKTALVEHLVALVIEKEIGCITADPFAETFEGDENSNSEVKWAGVIWRDVARKTGAAVFLVHHTKKYSNGMAGDADAARGAGALIGTARIVATLFVMTEEEAAIVGVGSDKRTHYVRFDDAKANLSLVTGVAKWFEKKTVTLPNERGLIPADEVGVLMPWTPPGPLADKTYAEIVATLEAIDAGFMDEDGTPTGHFFTAHKTGKGTRWAGLIIARMLALEEEQAAKVLKDWIKNGVLTEFDYEDGKATRKGLRYDRSKRPGKVD